MKDQPVVYAKPRAGTRTGRVWEVADEITRETGSARVPARGGGPHRRGGRQPRHGEHAVSALEVQPPGAPPSSRRLRARIWEMSRGSP